MAGTTTTFGTAAHGPPRHVDAMVVARLRAAGAVIVGKTCVPEMDAWPWTSSVTFGTTTNPWDLTRTPGGSATATASGMCAVALGSDGGARFATRPPSVGRSASRPIRPHHRRPMTPLRSTTRRLPLSRRSRMVRAGIVPALLGHVVDPSVPQEVRRVASCTGRRSALSTTRSRPGPWWPLLAAAGSSRTRRRTDPLRPCCQSCGKTPGWSPHGQGELALAHHP